MILNNRSINMKKIIGGTLFLIAFLLFPQLSLAVDFPSAGGFVNDFAGILKQEQSAEIEAILKDFEMQTSNEIVVAIVSSFDGLDSFTYSQELFTKWGVGKGNKNNGVLVLIGPSEGLPFPERGEIFINVGKGLEGALPDSLTGTILRKEIYPKFKAADYFAGVKNGVLAIIGATKGEYKADPADAKKAGGLKFDPVMLIWFGFIFISYMVSFLARSKSWWAGGVLGGAGGIILGLIFWTGFWILVSGGILGVLGLVFDFVVSRNYQKRLKEGKPTDFWHSGGGFWFGGGRGGGGFGGFGGGISGGGGAGGRW